MANVANIDVIDANSATVTVSTIDKTIGAAGTAATAVQTVQGISSMTPLLVTPAANSAVNLAQVAGASTVVGHGVAAAALRVELPTDGTGVIATVGTVTAVTAISNALPAGNNNIGDVDVATLPATPAGTNLIGKISASVESSTVYIGTTALTPKFAAIQLSATGTVVAAVTSKKIRVLAYNFMANGSVNVKWQSHVTPTDLTGLKYLVVNTGLVAPFTPTGWFETVSGEALDLNLSASIAVGGELIYVEV